MLCPSVRKLQHFERKLTINGLFASRKIGNLRYCGKAFEDSSSYISVLLAFFFNKKQECCYLPTSCYVFRSNKSCIIARASSHTIEYNGFGKIDVSNYLKIKMRPFSLLETEQVQRPPWQHSSSDSHLKLSKISSIFWNWNTTDSHPADP